MGRKRVNAAVRLANRTKGRAAIRPDGRVKVTLLLPELLDQRLGAIARAERLDRSALAAELLDAGLRRYKLDGAFRDADRTAEGQGTTDAA